jgi:hypothetical protein
VQQVGEGQELHDEVAGLCLHLEEQRPVADDVLVLERLYVREIFLEEEDVLPVESYRLYCIPPPRLFFSTMFDHTMRALADLLSNGILVLKKRMKPLLVIRIQLRDHFREGEVLIDEVGAGLATAILLQFDLQ